VDLYPAVSMRRDQSLGGKGIPSSSAHEIDNCKAVPCCLQTVSVESRSSTMTGAFLNALVLEAL
jgi:hypothetical protein